MVEIDLMVTLWPSFPHFERFANDRRLSGIRLNSAMMSNPELEYELEIIDKLKPPVPLYYDIKGRQLRVTKVHLNPGYLDLELNHPISVNTPTVVLFKAGADDALLERVEEDGNRLIFCGGPEYMVIAGESLHIRDKSLKVGGPQFTDLELLKIEKVKKAGFKRYCLSYVENQQDVDEFLDLVGREAEVYLKIENKKGLEYVKNEFQKQPNLSLIAARGDLYVETDMPHEILPAMRLIIEKDPGAMVGSRILLSVVDAPVKDLKEVLEELHENRLDHSQAAQILYSMLTTTVPSCVDFSELAWLYDIGYRKMLLCDELCLKENLLTTAVNVIDVFRREYSP
ncbi:hypothetical protein HYW46_05295 [Candidatus Daviesbacteria bacterium]|nr:hypothetical protein [Candidatus Daviesbacteria bacterium]